MPGPRSPSSHHVASKLWRVKNHLDCIGHCLNCCGSRTLNFRLLFILRFILFVFFSPSLLPLSLCALWLLLPYVADSYKAKHIRNHTKAQRERDRDSVWAREAKKLNVIEFIYGFVCSLFTLSVCVCECFFSLERRKLPRMSTVLLINISFILGPQRMSEPTRCPLPLAASTLCFSAFVL